MAMADAQHMHASKMARGESEYQGKLLEASTQNATFTIVLDGKPNSEVKINILPVIGWI